MKQASDLNFLMDAVVTLADNPNKGYALWIDAYDRLIRTENDNHEIVIGYERIKLLQIYGFEMFVNQGWFGHSYESEWG